MDKPKLLWVGDAGCPTGFARATHGTLDAMADRFDITVLGINYFGDPTHLYQYPIYSCVPGGDVIGVGRLIHVLDEIKPDVIVLQNDPWHIPLYMQQISKVPEYQHIPVIGAIAVDGLNCQGQYLNALNHCIFWTEFGKQEAKIGGYKGESTVIPLGVDTITYHPGDQTIARQALGLTPEMINGFIVGCVNRNQTRKRFDLTLRYFSNFVRRDFVEEAYLIIHTGESGDEGYNIAQLARYYGLQKRVIIRNTGTTRGASEDQMSVLYRALDVQINTSTHEGWGLPTWEGMACGIPQIVPNWAAYTEIPDDVAIKIDCTSTQATVSQLSNAIGGVADEQDFVTALSEMYNNAGPRKALGKAAWVYASQFQYSWHAIGERFSNVIESVLVGSRATHN